MPRHDVVDRDVSRDDADPDAEAARVRLWHPGPMVMTVVSQWT